MPGQEVQISKVVVHPLVLLSVVDHFNRMGKIGNQKRVVGVLLGCWRGKGVLDVSNSFAGIIYYNYRLGPVRKGL
jgi:26S proteasome regulatory subunit N8